MTSNIGSPLWMAPELCDSKNVKLVYSRAVDVYSFGIVMYEVMELCRPWSHRNFRFSYQVLDLVVKCKRPRITKETDTPKWYINLMKQCWHQDPTQRPAFKFVAKQFTLCFPKLGSMDSIPPPSPTSKFVTSPSSEMVEKVV